MFRRFKGPSILCKFFAAKAAAHLAILSHSGVADNTQGGSFLPAPSHPQAHHAENPQNHIHIHADHAKQQLAVVAVRAHQPVIFQGEREYGQQRQEIPALHSPG